MKPGHGASCVLANGTMARKTAADATRKTMAIRRSPGLVSRVDRIAGSLPENSTAAGATSSGALSSDIMAFPQPRNGSLWLQGLPAPLLRSRISPAGFRAVGEFSQQQLIQGVLRAGESALIISNQH